MISKLSHSFNKKKMTHHTNVNYERVQYGYYFKGLIAVLAP